MFKHKKPNQYPLFDTRMKYKNPNISSLQQSKSRANLNGQSHNCPPFFSLMTIPSPPGQASCTQTLLSLPS